MATIQKLGQADSNTCHLTINKDSESMHDYDQQVNGNFKAYEPQKVSILWWLVWAFLDYFSIISCKFFLFSQLFSQ